MSREGRARRPNLRDREPCGHCGEKNRHTPKCPAPYVARVVKSLSKAPDRILRLALKELNPTHVERLRRSIDGQFGPTDPA